MEKTVVMHPSSGHVNPKLPLDVYRPRNYLAPVVRERKTRTSKPKSRSGCKTCKIRRVKCDEAKPECARCFRFGVTCDGYETKKSRKETAIIVSKREIAIKEESLPLVQRQPDLLLHLRVDAEDSQYFRFFRDETVLDLCGGFFEEPVWTRMVLQSCHEVPCIQRIALSVAGLSRVMKEKQFDDPTETNGRHGVYALRQYVKSLRHFRLFFASNGCPDPSLLLMAGLLIYCCESLQGNLDEAIKQMQLMMSAFKDLRSLKEIDYRHLPNSYCQGSFEDEILTQLARLDGQLIGLICGHDPTRSTVIGISHNHLLDPFDIPDQFLDIRTARRFLEHIQHLSAPSILHEREQTVFSVVEGPAISAAERFNRMLREKLAKWWIAFKPHFDLACTPEGSNNFVAVAIMRIQALGCSLTLQTNLTMDFRQATEIVADSEMLTKRGPDMLLSTSKELLHWCGKVISHRNFVKGFVFDVGVMVSIWFVMVMAYKRELMTEVIEILRAMAPRKEGYWDSQSLAKTAEALLAQRDASGW